MDTVPLAGDALAPRQVIHASGPPVDPFAPTIYGPPIGPERFARAYAPPDVHAAPRVEGYRVIAPPAPPVSRHQSGWLRGLAVVAGLAVLLLLAGGALAATGHSLPGLSPLQGQSHPAIATTTVVPSPTPACPAPSVNPQAAQALDQVQLSTDVVGPALQPVDDVSSFAVGQTIHVVFHIQTTTSGAVNATFCTDGALSDANRPLTVPAGYATRLGPNARGQFYLKLASTNTGPGLVTLTWNGAVAAVVPFTVTAQPASQS
jgi:hypothetical protein